MKKLFGNLSTLGGPFWLLWAGESISMLGTQLVRFALGVWIFQHTGSVLSFTGSIIAGTLPAVFVTPIAGAIVDRFSRLHIMITADCMVAFAMLILLFLVWNDLLTVYLLYLFIAFFSFCSTFQMPAHQASVADMVAEENLTRASGATGVSGTLLRIVTPTLAGGLLVSIGLKGLVFIDLVTFLVGSLLAWKAFSSIKCRQEPLRFRAFLKTATESSGIFFSTLSIFREQQNLRGLLIYWLVQAAMIVASASLIVPLILSLHSSASLGLIMSCTAIGALIGSLFLVTLNSPNKRMQVILFGDAVLAICIVFKGYVVSVPAFCALQFFSGIAGSISSGCAYSLWMSKVSAEKRGSIMVMTNTGAMLSGTLMVVFGGLAIDWFFQPALNAGGILEGSVGSFLGTGEGRGTAFFFVLTGGMSLLAVVVGFSHKSLRDLH